jgi:uncharacterized membrane protein
VVIKVYRNATIPIKKTKNNKLSIEDKKNNHELSSQRVKCENIIGFMKRFKIISTKYRNRRRKANLRINLIASICNYEF